MAAPRLSPVEIASPVWVEPDRRLVYLAAAAVYLLLIPPQLSVNLGGLFLPIYRIFLIPCFLFILSTSLRGHQRFAWPDLFVVLAAAWIWLSAANTAENTLAVIEQGGSHTLDMAVAYFLARFAIRTPYDFRLFLILIAPGIALMSAFVIQEAITRVRIIQPWASAFTGQPVQMRSDIRLGLLRGAAGFPHPILAGIFLASFLPIYMMSGLRGWPKVLGVAASFGSFFTMSSAALLGLIVGVALKSYDWLCEKIANLSWRLFLLFAGIGFAAVELTSNTGFYGLLARYASLNPAAGYNRILIWKYGTENILRNPWFGIGYGDWDRPNWMHSGSFDHFWLIMALRFGILETVFLVIGTVIAIVMVALRSRDYSETDAKLLRGVAISFSVFALGVSSVSLWQSALVWFFMLMGIAVSLGSSTPSPGHSIEVRRSPDQSSHDTPAR